MRFRMLIGFTYWIIAMRFRMLIGFAYGIDVYQLRMIRIQRLFLPPSKRAIFLATFTLDNLKIGKSTLDPQHVKIAPYEISCYMAQTQPQKA